MNRGALVGMIVALIAIGVAWLQFLENQRLQSDLEKLTEATSSTEAQGNDPRSIRSLNPPESHGPSHGHTDESSSMEAPAETTARAVSQRDGTGDDLMRKMAKLIEQNPAMNEMISTQQRGALEHLYGNLVGRLNLDEEEEAYFLDLLLARQMQQVALGLLGLQDAPDPQELAAATAGVEQMNAMVREEIRKFLNSEEDFRLFERFESTVPIRREIDSFAIAAAGAGEPLSQERYEQIVELVQRHQQQFSFTHDFSKRGTDAFDLASLNEQAVDQHIRELRLFNASIAEAVSLNLTPVQLDIFRKTQEQMLQMQDFNLRMAAKLLKANAQASSGQ